MNDKPVYMHSAKESNSSRDLCYYLTLNVVDWTDIFIRPVFKQIIVESLNYFTSKKGLVLHGWCLMTNHLHLVASAKNESALKAIAADFQKFTTKIILDDITAESEVRRGWILKRFRQRTRPFSLKSRLQVWQTDITPIYIDPENTDMLDEYLEFIHNNPVRDRVVARAEDYLHSSARDYTGNQGLVRIEFPGKHHESHILLHRIAL